MFRIFFTFLFLLLQISAFSTGYSGGGGSSDPDDLDGDVVDDNKVDAAIVAFPTKAFVAAELSGNQTLGNGTTDKMEFAQEITDVTGEFDPTTNYRFTATTAKVVDVNASFRLSSLNTSYSIYVYIYKNGSALYIHDYTSMGTGPYSVQISATVTLAADDYIEIYASHNYPSTKTALDNTYTYLTIMEQ